MDTYFICVLAGIVVGGLLRAIGSRSRFLYGGLDMGEKFWTYTVSCIRFKYYILTFGVQFKLNIASISSELQVALFIYRKT